MGIVTLKQKGYKCNRCEHEWVPREAHALGRDPKVCPKCKSPYWDRPRQGEPKGSQDGARESGKEGQADPTGGSAAPKDCANTAVSRLSSDPAPMSAPAEITITIR